MLADVLALVKIGVGSEGWLHGAFRGVEERRGWSLGRLAVDLELALRRESKNDLSTMLGGRIGVGTIESVGEGLGGRLGAVTSERVCEGFRCWFGVG